MLLKELKVPLLNMPNGSTFHRRAAAGKNDRLNASLLQHGIAKPSSPRAAEALVLWAATKLFRYPFIVVHSVITLIRERQGSDLPSVSQTTRPTLTLPFRTAKNTIQQIQMRLYRWHLHGGHNTSSWAKHTHWNGSWSHMDNQITLLLGARPLDSWLLLTQLSSNESQGST